jgi:multiple antibiotic resistance protein
MNFRVFGEAFVTLVVITDPIGNAPIFLAVTRRLQPAERQRAAIQAVIAAGALIVGFAIFGELVLRYLHVSIESLSIAGGLLLLLVALEMLRGTDFPTGEAEDVAHVALVPLATPLVAGPGAIATAMVLWRNHPAASGHVAIIVGIVAAVTCVGLALLVSERVTRAVRPSIIAFLTRVFGLLLSAIAVQLVVDGVKGLS